MSDFDDIARRAADEVRATPTSVGDPMAVHRRRRGAQTRRVAASASVAALVVATAIVVATRGDDHHHLRVGNGSTSSTSSTRSTAVATTLPTTATTTPATTITTTPTPPYSVPAARRFPALVAAHGTVVRITTAGRADVAAPAGTYVALPMPDGSVVVQIGGGTAARIARWSADGTHEEYGELAGDTLVGVGAIDGHDVVVAALPTAYPTSPRFVILDTVTRQMRAGDQMGGSVMRASIALRRLVIDPLDGQTRYLDVRSTATPATRGVRIAAPHGDLGTRSYSLGVLSPDGQRLAFVDTAPWDAQQPDVVVRSLRTDRELLRTTLPRGAVPTFLDYDGRFVVVSQPHGWPALVLDTSERTPTWRAVAAAAGTVAIDRY